MLATNLPEGAVQAGEFAPPLGAMLIPLIGTFFLTFKWTRFRGGPA